MLNKLHQFRYIQQIEVNDKEKMTNMEEQKAKRELCASVAELINSTNIEYYENKPPNLEHIAKLTSVLANVHVSDVIRCDLTSANKIEHLLQCMQLALQFTLFSQSILRERNTMLEQRKVKMSEEVKCQIKKLSEEVNCLKTELNEIRFSNRNLRHKLFDFHTRNTQLEAAYKLLCKQSKAECMSKAKDATMENILEQLTMIAENVHLGICERKPCLSRTERRQEQEEEEEEIQQLQESKINRHRGAAMKIKGDVTCHNVINTTRDKSNKHQRSKQFNSLHNLSHSRHHDFNSHSNATEKCHVETKCRLPDLSRAMNAANEEKIVDDNIAIANHKTHSEIKETTTSKTGSEIDDKNVSTVKKIKNEVVTITPSSLSPLPIIATPSTETTQPATTHTNSQKNLNSNENNNNNNSNVGTSNLERSANVSPTEKDNSNQIQLNQMLHLPAEDHVNIKEEYLLHDTSKTGYTKEQSGANEVSELQLQEEKELLDTATAVSIPTLPQNTSVDKPILEELRHSFTTPMNAVTFPVTHHSTQLLDKGISVFSANSSYDTDSSESEDDNEAAGTVATIRRSQSASSAYKNIYKELAVNINNSLKPDIISYNNDDNDDNDNDLEPQSQLIKEIS